MRTTAILALGLTLLTALPGAAQTAGEGSDARLIKLAEAQNACPGSTVLSAIPLPGGKLRVVCGTMARPPLGGLAGTGGTIAAVLGIVVIAAALGGSSNSSGTN